ncbi:hypothetical protein KAX97_15270, partial [candidate division WOR-3 bacterium]|nr:hypothetical protein [candidate division WOR-3 bacterium]
MNNSVREFKIRQTEKLVEKLVNENKPVPTTLVDLYGKSKVSSLLNTLTVLEKSKRSHVADIRKHACRCKKHNKCKNKHCLKKYRINSRDINHSGYTITKPGYYCLAESVVFDPLADNVPAITI